MPELPDILSSCAIWNGADTEQHQQLKHVFGQEVALHVSQLGLHFAFKMKVVWCMS